MALASVACLPRGLVVLQQQFVISWSLLLSDWLPGRDRTPGRAGQASLSRPRRARSPVRLQMTGMKTEKGGTAGHWRAGVARQGARVRAARRCPPWSPPPPPPHRTWFLCPGRPHRRAVAASRHLRSDPRPLTETSRLPQPPLSGFSLVMFSPTGDRARPGRERLAAARPAPPGRTRPNPPLQPGKTPPPWTMAPSCPSRHPESLPAPVRQTEAKDIPASGSCPGTAPTRQHRTPASRRRGWPCRGPGSCRRWLLRRSRHRYQSSRLISASPLLRPPSYQCQ